MYSNGFVPRYALMEVQKGILLATREGRAFRRAAIVFAKAGMHLTIVPPAGGYRSYDVQDEMHDVSVGTDKAAKKKWNLASNSTVPLAEAGLSSHGWGTAADFLIDGRTPNATDEIALNKVGWFRTFGRRDPNHFQHRGLTGTSPVSRADCIKYGLFVQPA